MRLPAVVAVLASRLGAPVLAMRFGAALLVVPVLAVLGAEPRRIDA